MGKGRLFAPSLRSDFLGIRPRKCIFWILLGFVETFWFRALSLGRFSSLVGNRLGCAVAQMSSLFVPCIPRISLLVWDVCAGLLQGLTPQMPHFRLLINVYQSVILESVLHQYWEVWVLGILQGLPRRYLLSLPFCLVFLEASMVDSSCGTAHLIYWIGSNN